MALEDLLKLTKQKFTKKFKNSTYQCFLGDEVPPPTGIIVDNPLFEYVLDQRFLPYGRCYLAYGKRGNSKTSLFFDLAKLFQKNGGDVIWVETEKAADLSYARKQGVDTSRLVMPETHSLQEALIYIEDTIKLLPKAYPEGDTPVLICLDSLAGICPEYELQSDVVVGQTKVGEHARLCSSFYRRIVEPLSHEKCILLVLNQLKDVIGGQTMGKEPAEALIGGEAQRYHSTMQWKMVRTKDILGTDSEGVERKAGSRHQITVRRNKLGREGNSQKAEFDLYINGGIDWYSPLVRKLAEGYPRFVTKSGAYCSWNIENVKYIDPETKEEKDIPLDNMRESGLGRIIMNSPQAKELIREAFGINPLPDPVLVKQVEEDNKKKRKKTKKLSEEEEEREEAPPSFDDDL